MSEIAAETTDATPTRGGGAGEVTVIQLPRLAASSLNKERPISDLIKAQLKHIQHAEGGRLPKNKRSSRKLEEIRTEAQAAAYIAEVTRLLHPLGRRRSKPRAKKQVET
jgi:hypothetical protein